MQENWLNKKLIGALFMNAKGTFDHILKNRLFTCIVDLGIDTNLVV